MKKIDVNKALLDKITGLSCVENYLIYILLSEHQKIQFLYAKSYISFFDIVKVFCNENASYAYFNKIPRLQETAVDEGLISLNVMADIDEAALNHEYCCVQVKPDYIAERYKRNFWRDDHYLLLCEEHGRKRIFLNDTPRDVFTADDEEVSCFYGGKTICFDMKTSLNQSIKDNLLYAFQSSILKSGNERNVFIDNLVVIRDILGILKATRKRIYEYCSMYVDAGFMREYLTGLEREYSALEYMRIRKKYDLDKVNQTLCEIQAQDIAIIELLRKKMIQI